MRFAGVQTIYGADGVSPYMTRAWIGRLRLHVFHRGDEDPDPHDHPWDFWTFPLTAYVEEVVEAAPGFTGLRQRRSRLVSAFRLHHRPAEHTHRVIGRYAGLRWPIRPDRTYPTVPGRIVTIVWIGPSRRRWGFLKHRDGRWCWQAWRDYVFAGGKHAPCEPDDGERAPR